MYQKDKVAEVKYLNKDFKALRNALIDYTKVYFPDTYKDFNESSPGMMFIEMSAYIGDVLSYYLDYQFREALVPVERTNAILQAQAFGRKVKPATVATTTLDVFQTVPASGSNNEFPDMRFALIIDNLEVASQTNAQVIYRATDMVNFALSSSWSPVEITVFETSGSLPMMYLLKKSVQAYSGIVKSVDVEIGTPEKYKKILLDDENIVAILDVTDSDSNVWYEVPYLAQDTIMTAVENTNVADSVLYTEHSSVPYLLKYKRVPRRFTTVVRSDGKTELQFGAGLSSTSDENLIPNPNNVRTSVFGNASSLRETFDASNFLRTSTYGKAPANTTLTIRYLVGGGIESNVSAGDLTKIYSLTMLNSENDFTEQTDKEVFAAARDSLAVINSEPGNGGITAQSVEEIRQDTLAYFASQERCVTLDDYVIRALSMPAKFGSVAKVYAQKDTTYTTMNEDVGSIQGVDLYILTYDSNKRLTQANAAIKSNLRNYINVYRTLTTSVNIKDAFIINIGVDFEIQTFDNLNKKDVLLRCIEEVKKYFDIDNMSIKQPIYLNDLKSKLDKVEGVRTVNDVVFNCKYDSSGVTYSSVYYDIAGATRDGVVYPSVDPSIFEIKYPALDITGKAK
ncbi:MAG: hypothetical protein WC306_03485 [Candidatus Paceibacterota bacterium]|jgi:hypothetical protein